MTPSHTTSPYNLTEVYSNMKTIDVNTGRKYKIHIGGGCLADTGRLLGEIAPAGTKIAVISDTNVAAIYGSKTSDFIKTAGFDVYSYTFEAGEKSKNTGTVLDIVNFMAKNRFSRNDLAVALGGGVTGDITGFAASIYMRGIRFAQIPTSLLAQIDSSVGGKTGVDLEYGKNLCGTFWQPSFVLIDTDVLSTLPPRYFRDGLAEAIKYGAIKSRTLFERLEENNPMGFIDQLVYECVDIKRSVVESDEFDTGERALLNFGHTFGHAIEKYYNFEKFSHGEGVAIGMVIAAAGGEKMGLTAQGTAGRLISLLKMYSLPYSTECAFDKLYEAVMMDKKRSGDKINFIMLSKIGEAFIKQLSAGDMKSIFKNVILELSNEQ